MRALASVFTRAIEQDLASVAFFTSAAASLHAVYASFFLYHRLLFASLFFNSCNFVHMLLLASSRRVFGAVQRWSFLFS